MNLLQLTTNLAIGPWQMIIIFVVLILLFFPIIALISILKNEFKNNDKIMWVLIVLLVPFLGTILYFILGRPKRIKKN
ncbi:hypothetical protein GCM10023315_07820 [Algibacter aquimarinus]|uniref:Cardiolipin synthase N-terminal domain-containing protein n=2 Tax=Algibacter aquimarinus TaxID=1136748 RepID=A0ABP9H6L9_9FLAO